MQLRDYQNAAVESIYRYFAEKDGNPLLALPTGTGKSLIIGDFLRRAFTQYSDQRVLVVTHVAELLVQNLDKLTTLWPTAPAGVYSAGLKRRDLHLPILFCGIASIFRQVDKLGRIDLVIVDECHLISHKAETMYGQFLAALKIVNPHLKVIGLSATPYRLGLGHLMEGNIFTDVCFDLTSRDAFNQLIQDGWLAPLVTKKTYQELDVSGVRTSGGEFVAHDLQRAVDIAAITQAAVEEIVYYGKDRKHWLIFASGIEHAQHIAECLDLHSIPCGVLTSHTTDAERYTLLQRYKAGSIRAMVNMNILTTGFDFPGIDLIGMLRPTKSAVLWIQALGRGTRPSPDKQNCLVLDFAGNTRRLGPINDPILPGKKGAKVGGQAPYRVCPTCRSYCHASARTCPDCGQEFPRETKLATTAYTDEVIAQSAPQVVPFKVDKVIYSIHEKTGKPPSLQVSYYCGLRLFREWVCVEHDGYAGRKAVEWWRARSGSKMPDTVKAAAEAAEHLPVPKTIDVWVNTKYPTVTNYVFTKPSEAAA